MGRGVLLLAPASEGSTREQGEERAHQQPDHLDLGNSMSSLVAEAVLDEASLFLLRDGEGIEWRSILLGIPRALS